MNKRVGSALAVCGLVVTLLGGAATSAASGRRGSLPPPSFRPSAAWLSVTTGSSNIPNLAPSVWAITARSNLAALAPFDNFSNLRHLSRNAIYIWATTAGRAGADATFRHAEWPLRLLRFRVDHGWEGQPAANVQQRLRWVAVRDWHLDVRVYFGTQHPNRRLFAAAQQELDRLLLPNR
ncbi:MAG: hypothetical protein H0W90_15865 [Actinobacteria bacterium]|nr:hypothetical protein [Actinomycetota bacterium]